MKFKRIVNRLLLLACFVGFCVQACAVEKENIIITDTVEPTAEQSNFGGILWWRTSRMWNSDIREEAKAVRATTHIPLKPDLEELEDGESEIVWIGHATTLVRYANTTILTDPQFSDQASPVSWAGPERVIKPALQLDELPPINFVVISHNHYDHLDVPSLQGIAVRSQELNVVTHYLVPIGLGEWLQKKGLENVIELGWWMSKDFGDWRVTATPTQHHSGRGAFDKNKSQWAGWVFRKNDFSFFFAGDTGYSAVFKEIGQKLGPFSLAAIPIGGYAPRKLMRYAHVNPEEAVKIHQDLQAQFSVGIHWGTFLGLTDEPFLEPPKRLQSALEERNLSANEFRAIAVGEKLGFTSVGSDWLERQK